MGTDLIGQARGPAPARPSPSASPSCRRAVAQHDPGLRRPRRPRKPQSLVVAPTRELALQVSKDLTLAGADRGLRVLTVYGGVPYEGQLDALEAGVEVVVGTPGASST